MAEQHFPIYTNLAIILWQRGMTREELALALDIKPQTIGYIELGRHTPDLSLALRISEFLQVPVNNLFALHPFPSDNTQTTHRLV
jgi:DNA-binding XRE family transcriptional regulator